MSIDSSRLTDTGLAGLAGMKRLKYLTISGDFTDKGLDHLSGLKSLTHVKIVSDTSVSKRALERLRKNLPNIVLLYSGPAYR